MWGQAHKAHGKLLYTLQALNRSDLVSKAFDEIHLRKNMLVSLKGDEAETASIQLTFAKANGISEADFKREYNGFGVSARLKKAEELNRRYRVESVPMIFINGKYQTDVSMAGGKPQLIQLLNDLAATEKGR
jgi:protein dithiol oxidoreductase (disulfide-forming)